MKLCRHCNAKKVAGARWLCWRCYRDPDVRILYPRMNQREVQAGLVRAGDFYGGYRPPPEPTAALPGTEEKAAALAERVRLRVSLWHPRDADHNTSGRTT